ncbi:MAG: hypothetical protein OXG13_18285 [Gemmatimonadaceae bacterium]|nr:hypothetical protein [Gemmatimonadaceae bacterium]
MRILAANAGSTIHKYTALAAAALVLNGPAAATKENGMASEVTGADSASGSGRVQLDLQTRTTGSFAGCLQPALRATGVDWSLEHLRGYLGPAFAFSMEPGGGRLSQAENYEWHHFYGMLDFLEHESVSVALKGVIAVPPEEHDAAKARGWEMVRRALDDGYPAIVWQAMTLETKQSGRRPIPFLWSLITGYDEEAGTYSAHHGAAGDFTIGWDAFGHSDPVNWFCIMVFRPLTEPFDGAAASRKAVEQALEASRGERPGVRAPAHGLAAWEMWLQAFRDGTVDVPAVGGHAAFLIEARRAAATYLRDVEPHFPETARAALGTAADSYDRVAARISELRALCAADEPDLPRAAEVLATALEAESAALALLQQALDAN